MRNAGLTEVRVELDAEGRHGGRRRGQLVEAASQWHAADQDLHRQRQVERERARIDDELRCEKEKE